MSVIINEFEVVNQETQPRTETARNTTEQKTELSPREVQLIREHQQRRVLRLRAH